MASVFRAFDELLQVERAIKFLAPALCDKERIRKRFLDEARAMARLRHSNVVPVFDVGQEEGAPYIVMALIEGGTLTDRIQAAGGLEVESAVCLIQGVLSGLTAVHRAGVVHRDIKPQNVLIDLNNIPQLTDFGIAQVEQDDGAFTRTGAVMGTMAYMPPEQRQSAKDVTAASDIYAVGAMLYASLANKLPFDLYAQENQARLFADFPDSIRVVLQRACAYAPSERYQSAQQMQDALHHVLGELASEREATGPALAGDEAPTVLRSGVAAPQRTNLSHPVDAFIGRKRELKVLHDRLVQGPARLMTLLGAGGTGKTRLAQHFGLEHLSEFPGGLYFADLSHCRTVQGVCSAVASVLEVPLTETSPDAHLGHALRGRGKMMLILDNLEQVVDEAAPLVSRWLQVAANLHILITSRQRLQVAGEEVLTVNELPQDEARQLFEARALSVSQSHIMSAEDRQAVESIVEHLEGLPLALELAAARVDILSPTELLQRLERVSAANAQVTVSYAGLLGTGRRDGASRQETLRSTLDWSWDLMEAWEQAALKQCAVFEAGFSVEAAEATVDLSDWPAAPGVLGVIQALVRKSMAQVIEPLVGVRRLRLTRSISLYAAEYLSPKERAEMLKRHQHFFGGGQEASGDEWDTHSLYTSRVDGLDLNNLLAAVHNSLQSNNLGIAHRCVQRVCAISRHIGPYSLGDEVTQRMIKALPEGHEHIAELLNERAWFLHHLGDLDEMARCLDAALAASEAHSDAKQKGRTLVLLAAVADKRGETELSRTHLEAAVLLQRKSGDTLGLIEALRWTGQSYKHHGGQRALGALKEALELSEQAGILGLKAGLHVDIGFIHHDRGELEEAEYHYNVGLATASEVGDVGGEIRGYRARGWIQQERGLLSQAQVSFEKALQLARDVGRISDVAAMVGTLGGIHEQQHRPELAIEMFRECIELAVASGNVRMEGLARGNYAIALNERGRPEEMEQELRKAVALLDTCHKMAMNMFLARLAVVLRSRGEVEEAHEMIARAERDVRALGSKEILGAVLTYVAEVYLHDGREGDAEAALVEADGLRKALKMADNSQLAVVIDEVRAQLKEGT